MRELLGEATGAGGVGPAGVKGDPVLAARIDRLPVEEKRLLTGLFGETQVHLPAAAALSASLSVIIRVIGATGDSTKPCRR